MSEYQYFEFQALDRPLTGREIRELRAYSSRATITPTRFVNHYEWGNFKGDPSAWMEKYFDAFLYFANCGTHALCLRLPRSVLAPKIARRYCGGRAASTRATADFVHLEFCSEDEQDVDGMDDGSGWLSSLVPLRADLAAGDYRALHLGWLLRAQLGEVENSASEPPCPPGLNELTAPLQAFIEFLRIDPDLVAAAATRSRPAADGGGSSTAIAQWVASLPSAEQIALLIRLATADGIHVRGELLRRFRETHAGRETAAAKPRTVAELLAAAERKASDRTRKESEAAARERARREAKRAAARERHLNALARREPATWRRVEALVSKRSPHAYDDAVRLLEDLRDLAAREGRANATWARIHKLSASHPSKPTFIERLIRAGLVKRNTAVSKIP